MPSTATLTPPANAGRATPVATLVRFARERAGLSQRDLAKRMGVAPATVAAVETGEDPRSSTLRALRRAIPWIGAGRLLSEGAWLPAGPCEGAWTRYRDLCGFVAARLELRLFRDDAGRIREHLSIAGTRPLAGSLEDPQVRHGLLRAVFRGGADLLDEALADGRDAPGATLVLEEGETRHEIQIPSRLDRGGLAVMRERPLADGLELALGSARFALGLPVERLVLAVDFGLPEATPEIACYLAFATALGGDATSRDRLPLEELRSSARVTRTGTEWRAEVVHPQAHVAHELAWGGATRALGPLPAVAGAPFAAVIQAREGAGLSARALAARMGTSAAVVRAVERGSDARRSTLRSLLSALPELRPEALVAADPTAGVPLSDAELWTHCHELCGVAADAEAKIVDIDDEGWAQVTYRTSGLRALGPTLRRLAVRYGSRPPLGRAAAPPDEIACESGGDDDSFRTRLRRHPDGSSVHDLSFSSQALQRGVTYRRVIHQAFRARLPGAPEGDVDGTALSPAFPARRLRLELRLPRSRWPARFHAFAAPLALPPDATEAVTGCAIVGPAPLLRVSRRSGKVVLSVREPLLGLRYGIGWE